MNNAMMERNMVNSSIYKREYRDGLEWSSNGMFAAAKAGAKKKKDSQLSP